MTDLALTLSWLDMSQYLERFIQAGFDSWETVLDITEEDLAHLNVDLGHRRKLQREIANTRRLAEDPAFVSPLYDIPQGGQVSESLSGSASIKDDFQGHRSGKRGYRHHPKPDEDAPERPYSAYVLFSNRMREDNKDKSLSFTEISKLVGNTWQSLAPHDKELWKQRASLPWDKYKSDLAQYQKTDNYKQYMAYLAKFKATQPAKRRAETQRNIPASKLSSDFKILAEQKSGSSSRDSSTHHVASAQAISTASSMAPPLPQRREIKREDPQSTISRVRKENDPTGTGVNPLRVAQACEPCRQRKSKCHGERPTCWACEELNVPCYYADGKRDKERKLLDNLWKKVNAYEALLLQLMHQVDGAGQLAIQQSLLLQPQLGELGDPVSATPMSNSVSNRSSEHPGGESVASGVGSMGSTDHANEEDFTQGLSDRKTQAFVGQASEIRWMQRLERELTKSPTQDIDRNAMDHTDQPVSSRDTGPPGVGNSSRYPSNNPNPYPDDMDTSMIGDQLDPYDVPVKPTADALIASYFRTVHPSFPILDKAYFLDQYEDYFKTQNSESFRDRTFITTLQLVFAIGAVHAHLIEADWVGDERDHLLYFAKARILGIDTGILNDMAYLGQVQVFGLGGMYLMVTDQINRTWNIVGLAIRCAQSLGMHLQNTTPSLTDFQKEHRARVWYSILSLERNTTVLTGRPSMVHDQDCSVPLPLSTAEEDSMRVFGNLKQISSLDFGNRASSSPLSEPIQGSIVTSPDAQLRTPNATAYFLHYIELNALSQQVVASLYCPEIRHMKWSEIQRRIEDLDGRIRQWKVSLSESFDFSHPSEDPELESYRVALGILFHSTRTIINRPCLCRLDRRIADQSNYSNHFNRVAANRCVGSARQVLKFISDKPHNSILHQGTMWWMILHHLKRAATVLLLELAFRAEHMPSEAEEILIDAKNAINWLRAMAVSDLAARRSWATLSRLLRLAAQKVGGSTADIFSAPFDEHGETRAGAETTDDSNASATTSQSPAIPLHLTTSPSLALPEPPIDPNVWQPLDYYNPGHFFGDLVASDLDQYGFFQREGMPNLFPTPSEIGQMAGEEHEDQPEMWEDEGGRGGSGQH